MVGRELVDPEGVLPQCGVQSHLERYYNTFQSTHHSILDLLRGSLGEAAIRTSFSPSFLVFALIDYPGV
jgi:hypothetical protein